MAPKASERSLRIRRDGKDTSQTDVDRLIERLAETTTAADITYSIAKSGQDSICTVTLLDNSTKTKALLKLKKTTGFEDDVFDDSFEGITILQSPETIDLDICAVHGLGGNAMDTFQTTTKMWLRDLLPKADPFQNARIMTFGYDSTLFNRKSTDRLQDWADYLLRDLGLVRGGGIVARKAMIRLSNLPTKYTGIKLANCGMLFLSTPHGGTTEADYGEFLKSVLKSVAGLRKDEIVAELSSFNASSVDATEAFQAMASPPPFKCLCESSKTKIETMFLSKTCELVTQASAGFLGVTADKIQNSDHHTVCKFENKFSNGFSLVIARLQGLRSRLLDVNLGNQNQLPGNPNAAAFRAPVEPNSKWYVGTTLKKSSGRFTGRRDVMNRLSAAVSASDTVANQNVIALTGIGGIGKTEVLLEFALQNRNRRHIFFCQARETVGSESTLNQIATYVGSEILASKQELSTRQRVWSDMQPAERVDALIDWFGQEENRQSLFLVDDIDAIRALENVTYLLPSTAHTIIYTGRDPHLSADRDHTLLPVAQMSLDESTLLMKRVLPTIHSFHPTFSISDASLHRIAEILDGHALATCRAVQFMGRVLTLLGDKPPEESFIDMFQTPKWELRKQFLEYKAGTGRSILEVFQISLDRLDEEMSTAAKVLHVAAFLSGPSLRFQEFFWLERPWLAKLKDAVRNIDLFMLDTATRLSCLTKLESTSSIMRGSAEGTIVIPLIWLECLRQRVKSPGRVQILRQIYVVARATLLRGENTDVARRCLENCFAIAGLFGISEEDIKTPDEELFELLFGHQYQDTTSTISSLLQKCQMVDAKLSQFHASGADLAKSEYLSHIIPLWKQFSEFEKSQDLSRSSREQILTHLKVYDHLAKIVAPNPDLSSRLPRYRAIFWKKVRETRPDLAGSIASDSIKSIDD